MSTQRREEKSAPAHGRERQRELASAPLFYVFLFFPLGLSCVNWASQECCLFYLRSSLRSLDLPLFYFCGLFLSLSFSHPHFGLFFPILPNKHKDRHYFQPHKVCILVEEDRHPSLN